MIRKASAPFALLLALAIASGCDKKKEAPPPVPPPPPRGAASLDQLTTGIGLAKGLDTALAPPSMEVEHVYVLDDKRAVLAGSVAGGEAIALITMDAGKTWRSLRTDVQTWLTWSFAVEEGSFALALGPKETMAESQPGAPKKPAQLPPFQLFFGALEALSFGTATNVEQPPLPARPDPKVPLLRPRLALFSKEMASLIVEKSPKKYFARYVVAPGIEPPAELELPKQEQFVPAPIGKPVRLLSIKGREVLTRKWPMPGETVQTAKEADYIKELKPTTTLVRELSLPPACETPQVALHKITQPPSKQNPAKNNLLVVKSDSYAIAPWPAVASPDMSIGCSNDKFVVEVPDDDSRTLLLCTFEGVCEKPARAVFKPWVEKHERQIVARPTATGVAAVMSAQAGEKWGITYAQSIDGGKNYERPRVIGEGTGERGRVRFVALVPFGKRTLILLSADVTGTSRRGFYALVSDDDGSTWTPP